MRSLAVSKALDALEFRVLSKLKSDCREEVLRGEQPHDARQNHAAMN